MQFSGVHTDRKHFRLFLRTREAAAIQQVLNRLHTLTEDERAEWLTDHGDLFHQAFEHFIDNSSDTLSEIQLTDETLSMSEELIEALHDSSRSIEALFGQQHTATLKG